MTDQVEVAVFRDGKLINRIGPFNDEAAARKAKERVDKGYAATHQIGSLLMFAVNEYTTQIRPWRAVPHGTSLA